MKLQLGWSRQERNLPRWMDGKCRRFGSAGYHPHQGWKSAAVTTVHIATWCAAAAPATSMKRSGIA